MIRVGCTALRIIHLENKNPTSDASLSPTIPPQSCATRIQFSFDLFTFCAMINSVMTVRIAVGVALGKLPEPP